MPMGWSLMVIPQGFIFTRRMILHGRLFMLVVFVKTRRPMSLHTSLFHLHVIFYNLFHLEQVFVW
jgi:hypothetical protein